MQMADVMELIDRERISRSLSKEQFSRRIGIASKTYTRQVTGETARIGIESIRLYAAYAKEHGNMSLLRALSAYAVDIPIEKIEIR
jgi:transcriptional regulator with XRE-family HTH domain